MLDRSLEIKEFELESHDIEHIYTNKLWKEMNPLNSVTPRMALALNNTRIFTCH